MIPAHFTSAVLSILIVCINLIFVPPAVSGERLVIGGTGTALGSMKLLSAAFGKSHPDINVEVLPSLGSSGGIKAVAGGAVDIGLSSRTLKDEERSLGLQLIVYARTPLVPVVNKGVNLSGISSEDIIKIYNGKLVHWPDRSRIRPVLRPESESDTVTIKSFSGEMNSAVESALKRHGMLLALTDQDNADLLEKIPGAFGFSTLTQIISEKRNVRALSFNGVSPGIDSLSSGSYPYSKSLYMVISAGPSGPARKFMEFVGSPEGRRILEESGNLVVLVKPEK